MRIFCIYLFFGGNYSENSAAKTPLRLDLFPSEIISHFLISAHVNLLSVDCDSASDISVIFLLWKLASSLCSYLLCGWKHVAPDSIVRRHVSSLHLSDALFCPLWQYLLFPIRPESEEFNTQGF